MASWQAHLVSFVLRHTFKPRLARTRDAYQARAILNSGLFRTPSDVRITPVTMGGIPGEWVESGSGTGTGSTVHDSGVRDSGAAELGAVKRVPVRILLYLHGGGYFACSARTHRPMTTAFARRGFKVFAPNYRLGPENPFPAAVIDAVAAYRAIRSEAPVVMAGDSAGGGLVLAALVKLRDEGAEMPAAAVLFSPLTDLAGTGNSRQTNDTRCAMFHGKGLARAAEFYLCGADPRNPLASPLYADLKGLPRLVIHVGADETLLDDSTLLAERARAAGVTVELRVWPAVPHVWQMFHPFIPEGRQSLAAASEFLSQQLTERSSSTAVSFPGAMPAR
jgi:acetyl esterase/lipase